MASQLQLPRFIATNAVAAQPLRWPLFLLGFALAYFLAAKLGIATSLPPEGIVVLWPPNAIVLAALFLVKRENWWLLFLATVATEIAADVPAYPLWAATGYGIVNFSEAAIAAILLSKLSEDAPPLVELRDFVRFVAIGPFLASGTAALFGAAIYKIGSPDLDYLHYWRVFWLGDALGLLTVGTALLAWRRPPASTVRPSPSVVAEGAVLTLGLLAVSGWALLADAEMPRVYLIFPFLAWAALRFGVRGASIAIITIAAIAIGSAVMGQGPFAGLTHIDAVVALQALIAAVALSTFMLAFSTEASLRATVELQHSIRQHQEKEVELKEAYRQLKSNNQKLQTVAERTEHLRHTLVRKEMLLNEVHHRVKNSLQLVSSLLALHSRSVSSPELLRKFSEVQGQIGAIAATYDVLHQLNNVDVVDFCYVVPALCRNIQNANGESVAILIETGGDAPVSADTAVALSLALNELITNSIKHAIGEQTVAIAVNCHRDGENVLIRIADNGAGFPPGFDLDHAEGFGMRMVRTMVNQVGGQIRLAGSHSGAVVEIVAPVAARPEQE